jgi:hypothetical protein
MLQTKGHSATEGAAGGAAAGALQSLTVGDPLLAVLMLSVMVPVGALLGAAGGATKGKSGEDIEISKRAWERATAESHLQQRLQEQIIAELQREAVAKQVVIRNDIGPTTPDDRPRYDQAGAETVLEVAILEINFLADPKSTDEIAYRLAITVRARAVDTKNQVILDEMKHVFRSQPHTASDLLQDNAAIFTNLIDEAMKESAQAIVLEFFRIYYPPASSKPDDVAQSAAPYYVLQPEYPPYLKTSMGFPVIDDLQPTFRWESFPRPFESKEIGDKAPHFSDVTYDIAIYSISKNKIPVSFGIRCALSKGWDCPQQPLYTVGPQIYLRTGLTLPQHRMETPLQACERYAWTVRAHFRLDGHPRVTEWSGRYVTTLYGEATPWLARRSLLSPAAEQGWNWFTRWFPFRAPPPKDFGVCPD